MNVVEFLQQYKKDPNNDEMFETNFKELLKKSKEEDSLTLCFHTLLEHRMPFEYLKQLIEYDETSKQEIFNHPDTFKWACAFGHKYLIIYLNDKVKYHNIPGSINATFINYRLDNLKTLELLGYEKEIYTEPNFCQAISRADQVGCSLGIVEYFLKNIEKFPSFSQYVYNQLKEKDWVGKICQGDYELTLQFLIDLKLDNFEKKLVNYTDDIMSMALSNNKVKILDKVMQSYLKEIFIESYEKIKNKNLKDNIALDRNNYLNDIIVKYPELIKYEDIKLYMMNEESLNIDKFIKEKRKLTKGEIKKAYMELSLDNVCFDNLIQVTPTFKVVKMDISEVITIVNNIYNANEYNEEGIDYSYDGQYMTFNRENLLNHKEFKQYIEQIEEVIYDKQMFQILKKEQMKKNFELRLPEKTKTKSLKI